MNSHLKTALCRTGSRPLLPRPATPSSTSSRARAPASVPFCRRNADMRRVSHRRDACVRASSFVICIHDPSLPLPPRLPTRLSPHVFVLFVGCVSGAADKSGRKRYSRFRRVFSPFAMRAPASSCHRLIFDGCYASMPIGRVPCASWCGLAACRVCQSETGKFDQAGGLAARHPSRKLNQLIVKSNIDDSIAGNSVMNSRT